MIKSWIISPTRRLSWQQPWYLPAWRARSKQGGSTNPISIQYSETLELALPSSLVDLKNKGVSPAFLQEIILRGKQGAKTKILVGIELVEQEGMTKLDLHQIEEDLEAIRSACPDGLVLGWDLWNIPIERLEIVQKFWYD
jgi:hypothetical protein